MQYRLILYNNATLTLQVQHNGTLRYIIHNIDAKLIITVVAFLAFCFSSLWQVGRMWTCYPEEDSSSFASLCKVYKCIYNNVHHNCIAYPPL